MRHYTPALLNRAIGVQVVRIASVAEGTANLLHSRRVLLIIRVLAHRVGDVQHGELEGNKLTDIGELPRT